MDKRKGFTLVEVTLFLVITVLLFLGIAFGVQNSVFQQQYNDATQNFLEFMRSIYSKVSNPQSVGSGNSEEAIYGKLIVFGENTGIDGEDIDDDDEFRSIFVYDIVGNADTVSGGLGTGDVKTMLTRLNVSIARATSVDAAGNITGAELVSPEKYLPRWGAVIENTTPGSIFSGSIIVVRHPRSGTINTLYSGDVIEANEMMKNADYAGAVNSLMNELNINSFNETVVNFCVNPGGMGLITDIRRQNIRLVRNARNASDVELVNLDDAVQNECY